MWDRRWVNMAPGRVRVSPSAGLRKRMLNWFGIIRLCEVTWRVKAGLTVMFLSLKSLLIQEQLVKN